MLCVCDVTNRMNSNLNSTGYFIAQIQIPMRLRTRACNASIEWIWHCCCYIQDELSMKIFSNQNKCMHCYHFRMNRNGIENGMRTVFHNFVHSYKQSNHAIELSIICELKIWPQSYIQFCSLLFRANFYLFWLCLRLFSPLN